MLSESHLLHAWNSHDMPARQSAEKMENQIVHKNIPISNECIIFFPATRPFPPHPETCKSYQSNTKKHSNNGKTYSLNNNIPTPFLLGAPISTVSHSFRPCPNNSRFIPKGFWPGLKNDPAKRSSKDLDHRLLFVCPTVSCFWHD